MPTHTASIVVNAPIATVYEMFTHYEDFPRFMSYVKDVQSRGDGRSHWQVEMFGRQEWDAINEDWIENRQIGWRTTEGSVKHSGRVIFEPIGDARTRVTVTITYDPPAGPIGDVAEALGAGKKFEAALREDLQNFANMVNEAEPATLQHGGEEYLFHERRTGIA